MEKTNDNDKILLPHHAQQQLCETRLPYRQGRKLTAVKVYSIAKESNHLLIFGVPSLNLRQETKLLFMKFGKLLQFNISKDHAAEPFTETFHARYERIQGARLAKRTLDTKNFYGGSLHVCYAPELESVDETHQKLIKRKNDVLFRLKYLENEEQKCLEQSNSKDININTVNVNETPSSNRKLLNMGDFNVISTGVGGKRPKRNTDNEMPIEKTFKPCFLDQSNDKTVPNDSTVPMNDKSASSNVKKGLCDVTEIEIVDCTSVDKTTVSNIDEALNYNNFGQEVVFKMPNKPINKIKFNVNKKSLVYAIF